MLHFIIQRLAIAALHPLAPQTVHMRVSSALFCVAFQIVALFFHATLYHRILILDNCRPYPLFTKIVPDESKKKKSPIQTAHPNVEDQLKSSLPWTR